MVNCYLNGSKIRTPRGDIPVEELSVGDLIVSLRGEKEALEPIIWIGHRFIDQAKMRRPEEAAPVLIRKSAIADNQPSRDLLLSPEHCLILDGKCIPAKRLVNGGSITNQRQMRTFTYYHIELRQHSVILAEGLPVESYLDTGNRDNFENAPDGTALHPSFGVNADAERWKTDACAPLMESIEDMASIWQRLADRSVALGYIAPVWSATNDAGLHVVADGKTVLAAQIDDGSATFLIPAGVRRVALKSRFLIGADRVPYEGDGRRLGVAVKRLAITTGNDLLTLPANHPGLKIGWHAEEASSSGDVWRWTDGEGVVPWADISGASVLTVHFFKAQGYPTYDNLLQQAA